MEQNGGGEMNWTKIPTNLLISRTPDNELVAIVKYQLLWADLEYQPTDDIALRYMSNKQLALVKHYLNDIEAQVVSDIKLTVNHRGGQKTYYKKKQTLRQNTDNQNDSQHDSQRDIHTDGADKIRLDKINKKENIKKEKPDIFHSVFVIGGDDWKFSPECLKLAKKQWSNSVIRQIESDYSHRPPTEITIEKLLDRYPADKSIGFKKPTIDEVRAYCRERMNMVDADKWYDYYTSNGWKVGKNPMKNWKAAVRTWEKSGYNNAKPQMPRMSLKEMQELQKEIEIQKILNGER